MTVLDSSVLVAVVLGEPDAEALSAVALASGDLVLSAATLVETSIVVEARRGDAGAGALERLLEALAVEVVPFDEHQAVIAARAWRRFGKGRHPAGLNLGDCYSYALARSRDEPLLFKGDDFGQTDVTSAT